MNKDYKLNEWYEITALVGPKQERDMVAKELLGRVVAITANGVTLVIPDHGSVGVRFEHIVESRCTSLDEAAA